MSEQAPQQPPHGNADGNGNGISATPEYAGLTRFALMAAAIGIGLYIIGGILVSSADEAGGKRQFMLSWLTGFVFWLSLPVGSLALLGITYITGASWGVLLSRFFEASTRTLPLLLVLGIPLVASVFMPDVSPYPWSRPASQVVDEVAAPEVQKKFDDFNNAPGFAIRMVIYFAVWGILIFLMNRFSSRVEKSDDMYARRSAESLSGPIIVVFCLGNMICCTDLVLSTELTWASTMFPVIYCINQLLTSLTFCVAIFLTFSAQPAIARVLRPKFQIDMGSFTLALTLVWSYTSFCQFLLIWVANLPEEIVFFKKRLEGGWQYAARALSVLHFAVPFALLLFRDVKLHPKRLRAVAILIMIMCALDVFWWIEPAWSHGTPMFLLMDVGIILGIGGLWFWMFLRELKKQPILPTNYIDQLPGAH